MNNSVKKYLLLFISMTGASAVFYQNADNYINSENNSFEHNFIVALTLIPGLVIIFYHYYLFRNNFKDTREKKPHDPKVLFEHLNSIQIDTFLKLKKKKKADSTNVSEESHVSNTKLYSIKWGWIALILTTLQILLGSISLMAGVNNDSGEFREYIWPIVALFAVALILTLIIFKKTLANRTTQEIYIANWYIISAIIFTITAAYTAYLPFWQKGLAETIVQGHHMHPGVGLWFTLFTFGLLYYFIPQQINKPIYTYSLGILAFWTQVLFYTIIGTHHFVFSFISWALQTVVIVVSTGIIIPVVAATINFGITFKGHWSKVSSSYALPFFLTAMVYYFVGSMEGTAEAFRFTNLLSHFSDFNVGQSDLGFYCIIAFAIWGGTYAIVPRLTANEPLQLFAYIQSLKQALVPKGTAAEVFLYKKKDKENVVAAGDKAGIKGYALYSANCQSCHQPEGEVLKGAFPPLKMTPIVDGDNLELYVDIIMNGYDARLNMGQWMPLVPT